MNNLNNQNLALKKCAPSKFIPLTKEATVSTVTICGGSLFHMPFNNLNCEELCTNIYP